jgi:hypothetical protein
MKIYTVTFKLEDPFDDTPAQDIEVFLRQSLKHFTLTDFHIVGREVRDPQPNDGREASDNEDRTQVRYWQRSGRHG